MVDENLELREKLRFARFKPELLEPCERGCNSPRAGERHRLDYSLYRMRLWHLPIMSLNPKRHGGPNRI